MVGPVDPPFHRYIWIFMAIEYFTKWVEVIPLRKATRGVMANFIKENIIVRFRVPHKIRSDNDTPFVNREVRKIYGVLSGEVPLIIALLSSREWAGGSNKQNSHQDYQQDEPGIY